MNPIVTLLVGDVRARLAEIPDDSIHCVVTSPPYWGLRDYGVVGQLGLEATLGEHLDTMVAIFREIRRVLRKDGTCWVNYGDCYASAPNGRSAAATKASGNDDRTFRDKPFSTIGPIYDPAGGYSGGGHRGQNASSRVSENDVHKGRIVAGGFLKPKDLVMVPNRFAIAMQDDGWWVRSEIVWHKPNAMPESVTDRPATAHEKVWLFTKSERYWYDAAAVRTAMKPSSVSRLSQNVAAQTGSFRANGGRKTNGPMKAVGKLRNDGKRTNANPAVPADGTAHLKNVWRIATRPFRGAHFATFPPALPEICIKAGCPVGGTVLDPFAGAGTTGMVAASLRRNAILIEISPQYARDAAHRIRAKMHTVNIIGEVAAERPFSLVPT